MRNKLEILCISFLVSLVSFSAPIKDTLNYISWEEALTVNDPLSVIAIDFTKLKLDTLPKELQRFKNIRGLRLTKNNLTQLPSYFKNFQHLEYLHLNKNKFEVFPYQVFHLFKLKYLDISKNNIDSIPEGIKSLKELLYLDLWSNKISTFPESLGELQQLKFLDARGRTFSPTFVEKWINKLPSTTIKFDKPCKCLE